MKKEIRKTMLELRNKIEQEIKIRKDEKIALKFIEFMKQRHIKTVLLYASFGSEVDTWKIFEQCKKNLNKNSFSKGKGKKL